MDWGRTVWFVLGESLHCRGSRFSPRFNPPLSGPQAYRNMEKMNTLTQWDIYSISIHPEDSQCITTPDYLCCIVVGSAQSQCRSSHGLEQIFIDLCHWSPKHLGSSLIGLRSDRTGLRSFTGETRVRVGYTTCRKWNNMNECCVCVIKLKFKCTKPQNSLTTAYLNQLKTILFYLQSSSQNLKRVFLK